MTPLQAQTFISAVWVLHAPILLHEGEEGGKSQESKSSLMGFCWMELKCKISCLFFVNEWTEEVSPASLKHAELFQTFEKNTDNLYFNFWGEEAGKKR